MSRLSDAIRALTVDLIHKHGDPRTGAPPDSPLCEFLDAVDACDPYLPSDIKATLFTKTADYLAAYANDVNELRDAANEELGGDFSKPEGGAS